MYIFVQNTARLFELDFFRPASSGREFSAEVTLWRPRPPSYGQFYKQLGAAKNQMLQSLEYGGYIC